MNRQILNFVLLASLCVLSMVSVTRQSELSLLTNEGSYEKNWGLGYWIGDGYSCGFSGNIPEDIKVTYENGEFVATKVNGDKCVTSGTVTFRATLPESWSTSQEYPCTITLGNVFRPNSTQSTNCKIKPVDNDNFVVNPWNLKFRRGRLDGGKDWPYNYFLGFWIGTGYSCAGNTHDEDVNVTYKNGQFFMTKVHGDDCVEAGQVTVKGTLPANKGDFVNDHACIITLGSPAAPQSTTNSNCKLEIIDDNHFKVKDWGIEFRRGRLPYPGLTYPYDYFLGTWVGHGYTCSDVVGLLKQEVEITYSEGSMLATKLQGDSCVAQGQLSWSAILEEEYKYCEGNKSYNIPCYIFFGTPTNPHSALSNTCRIEILDEDTFKIPQWNLIYRRKGCWTMPKENRPLGA